MKVPLGTVEMFDFTSMPPLSRGLLEYVAIDAGLQSAGEVEDLFCPNELHHIGVEADNYECLLLVADNAPVVVCSQPECAERCSGMTHILRARLVEHYFRVNGWAFEPEQKVDEPSGTVKDTTNANSKGESHE